MLHWYTGDFQPVLSHSSIKWVTFNRLMTKKGRQDFGRQVGHIGRQVGPLQ